MALLLLLLLLPWGTRVDVVVAVEVDVAAIETVDPAVG